MRNLLRSLLNWLDSRFPPKVVVTQAELLTFKAQMDVVATSLATHSEEIADLKKQMGNINVALGFSMPKVNVLER